MGKGDILVAEDDAVLRNLYVKKFAVAGFEIRTAADGEETLKALEERLPQALLLDIRMPKVDGFQIMERYPRQSRQFPIILLTNFDDEKSSERAQELGADEYFVKKDMTIRTLLQMVERVMEAYRKKT